MKIPNSFSTFSLSVAGFLIEAGVNSDLSNLLGVTRHDSGASCGGEMVLSQWYTLSLSLCIFLVILTVLVISWVSVILIASGTLIMHLL